MAKAVATAAGAVEVGGVHFFVRDLAGHRSKSLDFCFLFKFKAYLKRFN